MKTKKKMPKRFYGTVPDYVATFIEDVAKNQGRGESTLVARILEDWAIANGAQSESLQVTTLLEDQIRGKDK